MIALIALGHSPRPDHEEVYENLLPGVSRKLAGALDAFSCDEARQLEDRFKEGLPTRDEMAHPARNPGAVRKHMKWLTRNEASGAVDRYRQIQRTINPGDERSIENLRKDK